MAIQSKRQDKNIPSSMEDLLIKWQAHANKRGVQMLTYLSKILFNIQRLPLFEDRSIALIDKDDDFFELLKENKDNDLNIEIINSKLEELKKDFLSLYEDTQKRIEEKFKEEFEEQEKNGEEKHILLSRRIIKENDFIKHLEKNNSYSSHIYSNTTYNCEPDLCTIYNYVKEQKNNNKNINIQMNILTSWAQNTADYYGIIKFEKKVNPKDIIFFTYKDDFSGPIESNEYIVLNRSATGIISFPAEDIDIRLDKIKYVKTEINSVTIKDNYLCSWRTPQIIQYVPYMPPYNKHGKSLGLWEMLWETYRYYKKISKI